MESEWNDGTTLTEKKNETEDDGNDMVALKILCFFSLLSNHRGINYDS